MIRIYADDALVYDSRLEDYELLGLKITTALNKGGTAEIIMPPGHPAYSVFVAYRTIVTIYRDNELRFRGRALYVEDNYDNERTLTCEGELCLLQDAVHRPYLYQDSPAAVFTQILRAYNSQVEDFKQFVIGDITVTDSNSYIRLESESAESILDTLNKLLERCGGYYVFTTDVTGKRAINWLATIDSQSSQTIEFGENLLNFSRSGANTAMATVIVPYGAKDETTGERVTIESVGAGVDYVVNETARAVRGTIMQTVTWDDVTKPSNLLSKAYEYLASTVDVITSLELSALDLSYLEDLDSFHVGDNIRVVSKPHGVDSYFQLSEMTEDLLDPSKSTITLGKQLRSMTASTVAGDAANLGALASVQSSIKSDYILNTSKEVADAVAASEARMTSLIEQKAGKIELSVSGGLGGSASITLSVDGVPQAKTIDLANVRQAFAADQTEITIAAGLVTFDAGTIVINSAHFKVDATGNITATAGSIGALDLSETGIYSCSSSSSASFAGWYRPNAINGSTICFFAGAKAQDGDSAKFSVTYGGKLEATGAEINGTLTTESSVYKAQLDSGGLKLYYDDQLCGTVNTKYWSNASGYGVSLRIEEAGQYIMFSHPSDSGSGYAVDYYLNYGWSTNYDEMHIFQTSARFLDKVYFSNAFFRGLYMYENAFIKSCESDGTALEEMLGYSDGRVYVGSNGCTTMLRGSTVYLKNTSTTVTSDRNEKNSIEALPEGYEAFVDGLAPVRFKYNEGTSGRYHVGYIAQDVAAALEAAGLSTQDFAGYVDMGDNVGLGLAYDEFVALLHLKIKRLEQRLAALTAAQ